MREVVDLSNRGPLREPVLIAGLAARRRGGRSASRSVQHLVEAWQAEPVAVLECEEYIDLTVRRPEIDTGTWQVEWPDTTLYLASPPGSRQDLLLAVGFEPHFHWSAFVSSIAAYADALGVKTLISLRSFPGNVPHTRPSPLVITSSDIDLELQFGVQARNSRYQGPTDVAGVLATHVQSLRWRWADLTMLQPLYFPRMANAQMTLSLATVLERAFGAQTPKAQLQSEVAKQRRALDASVAASRELSSAIDELEKLYDASAERMEFLTSPEASSGLPSGEEVVREVERLFREDGPSG
jgi:hypothetical protein